jgi:hypothetical protein
MYYFFVMFSALNISNCFVYGDTDTFNEHVNSNWQYIDSNLF